MAAAFSSAPLPVYGDIGTDAQLPPGQVAAVRQPHLVLVQELALQTYRREGAIANELDV